MTATAIRQKLYEYISTADDSMIRTLYTMLEGSLETHANWCESEELVEELNTRRREFLEGEVEGISWQDAKANITGAAQPGAGEGQTAL